MYDWGNGISKNEGSDTRKRCDSVTPNKKNEHLLLCCLWLILNLGHFVKNPIHSVPIWPLPQRFPVIVFPRFQKQNTKGTNFDKFNPLYPPSSLSIRALCKHMHFPLSAHNYLLNFFLQTLRPDTSPLSHTKGSTVFILKICFFKALLTNIPDHSDRGWIEGRHHITYGERSLDHTLGWIQ